LAVVRRILTRTLRFADSQREPVAAVSIEKSGPQTSCHEPIRLFKFADSGIKRYGVVYMQDRKMAASSGCPPEESACLTL
jgi:hypothetical protein